MTTQVLVPDATFRSEPSRVDLGQSGLPQRALPFQTSHQVELLHLQAETEALLQHLQHLKQQKTAAL